MRKSGLFLAVASFMFVTACSGVKPGGSGSGNSAQPKVIEDTTPVTLNIMDNCSALSTTNDPDLEKTVNGFVQKKYPYITVKINNVPCSPNDLQKFIAAGQPVDIVSTYSTFVPIVQASGMMQDQTPLVKKHLIDLNRFEPQILDDTKRISFTGELLGLPYNVTHWELYYNKDLFDKFAVSYPKDGMTWDDVIDLTKKMNRLEGSSKYYGFAAWHYVYQAMDRQMGIDALDPKTDQPLVDSDQWRTALQWTKKIYDAQNSLGSQPKDGDFMKVGNIAMYAAPNALPQMKDVTFQWDVVQFPSIPGRPNIYPNVNPHILSVTKQSKYQDQAMDVIQVITSDEVQSAFAEMGKTPTLKNKDVFKNYGKDLPYLSGKNIAGIFKSTPAPMTGYSQYTSSIANGIVNTHTKNYLNGTEDLNTALRNAAEEMTAKIKTEKAQ